MAAWAAAVVADGAEAQVVLLGQVQQQGSLGLVGLEAGPAQRG